MNVFDFDGTIYNGDSSKDFFFYCLKHYPKIRKKIFPVIVEKSLSILREKVSHRE